MAKILVTGSTGFIGKRLVYRLVQEGHEVYALVRIKGIPFKIPEGGQLHLLYGDLRDPQKMEVFPQELDAAYYLVHAMGSVVDDLTKTEERIAQNFKLAIEKTNCRQVIYLGGIIEDEKTLSPHLHSRLVVEKVLKESHVPFTILRSSIIIGSGSASFEIIQDLVEKLPLMVAPKWVRNYCQPIAINDVLFYLNKVLLNPLCLHQTYDIGGPEAITFRQILLRYAAFRKLKRFIINVPFLSPRLSSYWLVFITPVRFSICKYLVESMKQDTRKLNLQIDAILPHSCMTYEESLKVSFQKIAENEVISTWNDDWDLKNLSPDIQDFVEVPQQGCFKDIKSIPITIPLEDVHNKIWSIGGLKGWYSMNWAWRFRGLIDQFLAGPGLRRGRRDPTKLEVGDSVDFWRVILANEKQQHLIFYAEMKLPGQAWLEFEIDSQNKILKQTATFRAKGLGGRLYWYLCLPFHLIIFRNMAKALAQVPEPKN